jgi:hypothetical protein
MEDTADVRDQVSGLVPKDSGNTYDVHGLIRFSTLLGITIHLRGVSK